MLLKVFSVFDAKVGAYLPPMFFRSKGEALRAFASAVNKEGHDFNTYAPDYTLFELGDFHDDSANFLLHNSPKSLGVAVEFISPVNVDMEGRGDCSIRRIDGSGVSVA